MSDAAKSASWEEREAVRRAEAIADGTPCAPSGDPEEAASPLLRRMGVIAEVAAAFGEAGPTPDEDPRANALFNWGPLMARRALGEGSFGEVFAAWDSRLRREVALKLRRDAADGSARRWLDEARAQAQVRHPNVLTVYGADEHDGRVGIWTDIVHGRDLEAILKQQGPFSEREATTIGLELCAALAAVHARGLVHGDVKTRNVMREDEGDSPGRIVLMDFGSAHEASLALTAGRGSSVGTPLAMAPEVLRGEPVTAAADLYSLGVLLFRLVSGRYPVEAASLDELREKHERHERASLRTLRPALPREFVRVVERAIDPEPRLRFADAAEFERALQGVRPSPRWRRPMALAAIVVVAVAVGVMPRLVREWGGGPGGNVRPGSAGRVDMPATPPSESAAPPGVTAAPGARDVAPGEGTGATPPIPTLRAEATLFRLRAGESAPLVSGGEIEPGDRLFISLSCPERVNAYVLDEDGAGHVTVLFPCAGAEAQNPLGAGVGHRLPGSGEQHELNWLVTSAEGRETFLVVLAREPLEALESSVASLPRVSAGASLQYATVDESDLRRLRGVSRLTRDPVSKPPESPGHLIDLARELGARPDAASLWVRLVEVSNPKH